MLPMVKRSSWVNPLPPVPWTGNRMGQAKKAPTRQIMESTLRNRRKKNESTEQLLRM